MSDNQVERPLPAQDSTAQTDKDNIKNRYSKK
jgi:hypothetical protein